MKLLLLTMKTVQSEGDVKINPSLLTPPQPGDQSTDATASPVWVDHVCIGASNPARSRYS